jgi:NADH dehydrogenase [ubiquinone] 1 alpha subcomplex assembly factor 6
MIERVQPPLSYCAEQVREHDPDRDLATLFAPEEIRETLFALYAFDHEIAKVRDIVSEPIAGMVRLQWWRDALDAIEAGMPPAHPVVAALHMRWPQFAPLRSRLDAAIDARELELTAEPPADLAALERRLEASCGQIALAAADLLGATEATHAAAWDIGLALGLIRLIQALPADLRHDRLRLPSLMLARHHVDPQRSGVDAQGSGQAQASRALSPVVAELAERARDHLRAARRYQREVPKRALAALLHASLLDHYLRRLARAGHDPFAQVAIGRTARAPLELLGLYVLGRY